MNQPSGSTNPFVVGTAWGVLQFGTLLLSMAVQYMLRVSFPQAADTVLGPQAFFILVLALAISVGYYIGDIASSRRGFAVSQLFAALYFLIFAFGLKTIGRHPYDLPFNSFGEFIFLSGLFIASFFLGLIGSTAGCVLVELSSQKRIRKGQRPPSIMPPKDSTTPAASPLDPWKELMDRKRRDAEARREGEKQE